MLRNCARHFDLLLWLDADTVVSNLSNSLPELVKGIEKGRRCDLIMAEDVVRASNIFNSGVMAIRGGEWAYNFFDGLMAKHWDAQQEHNAGWTVSVDDWEQLDKSRWFTGPLGCNRTHALQAPLRQRGVHPAPASSNGVRIGHAPGRRLWEQRFMHKYFWEHPAERCRFCVVRPARRLQAFTKRGQWASDFAVHATYTRGYEPMRRLAELAKNVRCDRPPMAAAYRDAVAAVSNVADHITAMVPQLNSLDALDAPGIDVRHAVDPWEHRHFAHDDFRAHPHADFGEPWSWSELGVLLTGVIVACCVLRDCCASALRS